jgi:hypothetical protein
MNPVTDSPLIKPQFFCSYCASWKHDIDKLPTRRQGHYICAPCEDRRIAALAKIKAQNRRWDNEK